MKIEKYEAYKAEQKEIKVVKTRDFIATTSSGTRDINNWNEVKLLAEEIAKKNHGKIDFVLWNTGFDNGISLVTNDQVTVLRSKCDFKVVENLFISELIGENVDELTIVKKGLCYQAKYKTNGNNTIQNYIYEPCDLHTFSTFLENVFDASVPEKDHYFLNGGLAHISNRGLKGIKSLTKYKFYRSKTYRNFIK